MLEQQRLDYLQAMGVTLWLPRQPLTHAADSRWLPPLAELADVSSTAVNEAVRVESSASPSSMAKLLVNKPSASQPATSVAEPSSDTSVSAPVQPVDLTPPRFELHFLPVANKGLWVCSSADEVEPMMRFLHRVMTGMQQPLDVMSAAQVFRWPFLESSQQDQSKAVALQALKAQCQFYQSQGVQYVVAFGPDAISWLGQVQAPLIFHADSVSAAMGTAAEKRRLWQALLQQELLK